MRISASLILMSALALNACSSSTDATVTLPGTYVATVLSVSTGGGAPVDYLAAGVTLSITINSAYVTSGSFVIPAGVSGGPLTTSMAGSAALTGSTVHFTQTADTFVRDLTWTLSGTALTAASQSLSGSAFTVTLTRQN